MRFASTTPARPSIMPESLPSARNVTSPFIVHTAAFTTSTSPARLASRLRFVIAHSTGSASYAVTRAPGYWRLNARLAAPMFEPQSRMRGDADVVWNSSDRCTKMS